MIGPKCDRKNDATRIPLVFPYTIWLFSILRHLCWLCNNHLTSLHFQMIRSLESLTLAAFLVILLNWIFSQCIMDMPRWQLLKESTTQKKTLTIGESIFDSKPLLPPPGSVLTLQVKFRNDSLRLRGITILRLHLWHLQIFNNSTIAWSCASFWVEPCSTGWRHIQREQRKLGRCSHTPKIPELFLVVPQEYLPYNYKIIKAEPFHDFHLTTDSQVPMTIIEKAMWMICGKYLRFSSIN